VWAQGLISRDVMTVSCVVTAFNSPQMAADCLSDIMVTTYQLQNPEDYSLKY
jgi:hypothetical protein